MSDKKQEVQDLFEKFEFPIEIQDDNDQYCSFKTTNCFIFFVKENDDITLSFDASVRPDYSAFIVSLISNNINCNRILVSDLHYNKHDDTYFGENAYDEYIKELYDEIVENYQQQIKEYEMLQEFKPNVIN